MKLQHAMLALQAVTSREISKFLRQGGRLASALVRPLLWLVVFAAGFRNVFGVSIIPPYETYIPYQVYIVPGLLGMVLLFNGMQSSLAMVYDREMGMMRLLLTAPLPRSFLLFAKLLAGTLLSVLQAYAFLAVAVLFDVDLPWSGWIYAFPAIVLAGLMLGALGLLLSVHVRQLENFAGVMNFVIFPLFFASSALYPLWRIRDSSIPLYEICRFNPFTWGVELIRFSLYAQMNWYALAGVAAALALFLAAALWGYDPGRGMMRFKQGGG